MILESQNRHLIVGAFGFVGTNLARNLLKWGEHVVMFGHKPSDEREVRKLAREYPDRLEIMYGEVIPNLHEVFMHEDANIAQVYHLAHRKVHSQMEGREIGSLLAYNYDMDIEVFDVCEGLAERRPIKLLYVSSGEVYGESFEDLPILREESPCTVTPEDSKSVYPISKIAGEAMLMHGGWKFGWSIARLQNPYGPGMGRDLFITKVMKAAVEGMPYFIADADHSRPYVYIDDVASAFRLLLDTPAGTGRVFNVAAGREYQNSEVVATVSRVVGADIKLMASEDGKSTGRNVSVEKIAKFTSWSDKTPLEEGIRRTWEYYRPSLIAEWSINGGVDKRAGA